jgi:uncharacterized protein
MKIIIPGGSGQIGTVLARALHADGHDVVVLSRRPDNRPWRVVTWDGVTRGAWSEELEGADVLINLAGRSVNCRYTAQHRREIVDSRLASTRVIGEAIARAFRPPRVWLQSSTATIYAHRYDSPNDEASGIIGGHEPGAPDAWNFSIDVATSWERAFDEAATPHTRKVALRTAMVMNPDRGGTFDTLLALVRRGLGGQAGDGRQFMSWIHDADFIQAIQWLIDRTDIDGIINVASPHPIPNAEFMRELRRAAGIRGGLPVSRWMLEAGAVFMRTETELILKSRRVVPGRLQSNGFVFAYPHWADAARDLCRRSRLKNQNSRLKTQNSKGKTRKARLSFFGFSSLEF